MQQEIYLGRLELWLIQPSLSLVAVMVMVMVI
jgi:hypothetical protein